jgi:hypothetical protein
MKISELNKSTSAAISEIKKYLDGNTVLCKTANGGDSDSLHVEAGTAGFTGETANTRVSFVIPAGYRRLTFGFSVEPKGLHAGGDVSWASADPHDGDIFLHAWCDAFSNCDVKVFSVTAVKE